MPVSVNKLVFQEPECETLAHSKLEIGTYTTNKVKLVVSCMFYLVHPDIKCLQEVIFYVASNSGSVLSSCGTTLALGLIEPHTRLDYLPSRASPITSSTDHPKKTKSPISVHASKKESEVSSHRGMVSKLITTRTKFLPIIQLLLMVLDAFFVPHTILRSIPVSHPSKLPVNQSLYISKSL